MLAPSSVKVSNGDVRLGYQYTNGYLYNQSAHLNSSAT